MKMAGKIFFFVFCLAAVAFMIVAAIAEPMVP